MVEIDGHFMGSECKCGESSYRIIRQLQAGIIMGLKEEERLFTHNEKNHSE